MQFTAILPAALLAQRSMLAMLPHVRGMGTIPCRVYTISATDHIGYNHNWPQPHRPHEKTILATVNNHVGHRKKYCYLASAFKSYPFKTRNVCNTISHKLRVKQYNNCRLIRELDFSLPRPFAPGSESSTCGTFASWNFSTLELSLPGIFAPGTFQANTGWRECTQSGAKYTRLPVHSNMSVDLFSCNYRSLSQLLTEVALSIGHCTI